MKLVWSPLSLQRIREIADYIASDNPPAAGSWIDSIFKKVQMLKINPEMGRIVPETGRPDIRELLHKNYRIIYAPSSKRIAVLTIRHCKQILPVKEITEPD